MSRFFALFPLAPCFRCIGLPAWGESAGPVNLRPTRPMKTYLRFLTSCAVVTCVFAAIKMPADGHAKDAANAEPNAPVITIDTKQDGKVFEGIGGLSAGASSRLLPDYPAATASDVLDFLFKPNFGASLHHLKVEIGGEVNSTDGCEPSHMRSRDDENYTRGYEWWLMKEARRRNPDIMLDCLEWGVPGWIGNGKFYSQDNADYIVKFIKGAKSVHQLDIRYTGIWNESPYDVNWIKLLRKTLDAGGLRQVQIVAADEEVGAMKIADDMAGDAELAGAIQVVCTHYPKFKTTQRARDSGKRIWSSEDGPWRGDWRGACILAKCYNRNYIIGGMTKTIFWSLISSYYDNLPLPGSGIMRANTPWSGFYEVQPAVWATAHTTQFAQPGWKYIDGACGMLGNGSYVTLVSPDGGDFSMIVETVDEAGPRTLAVRPAGNLAERAVSVWRSNAKEQFVKLADISPANGGFSITIDGQSIYSLTTTKGQSKGTAVIPEARPFPGDYADDFESYQAGVMAKYFSDQGGIFEVARRADGKGNCLRQVMDREGIRWRHHVNPPPETLLGAVNMRDCRVATDVMIVQTGSVSLLGRVAYAPQTTKEPEGYRLRVDHVGAWELRTPLNVLASGKVDFSAGTWHKLALEFKGSNITAMIDGVRVAEVVSAEYAHGLAGVGSDWNIAEFDNFALTSAPAPAFITASWRAAASSDDDTGWYSADKAIDMNKTTRWNSAPGKNAGEWLDVILASKQKVSRVTFQQFQKRITSYKIQYRDGGQWHDAFKGGPMGEAQVDTFPAVATDRVRLLVLATVPNKTPSICEMQVFEK